MRDNIIFILVLILILCFLRLINGDVNTELAKCKGDRYCELSYLKGL